MREPEWTHLQNFLTLARVRRLAAAGRRLRADHTTVSRHIGALESTLSVRLFNRREDGFYLTSEGERLFEAAEQKESLMLEGVFNLSKQEADIAINLSRPTTGRLISRKILDYNFYLYAAKSYLETHPAIEKAADLQNHPIIGYIEDLTAIPELNFLDQIHSGLKPTLSSSTLLAQLEAIRGGAGVGVLPAFLARTSDKLVRVLPNCTTISRTFWLNVHADLHRLTRIRLICEFITEQMQSKVEVFA